MDTPSATPANRKPLRALAVVGLILLVGIALWVLALSFVVHITPDASIYLLHARTFTETLNRFTLSHDSKGIMLMFLLALPVRLLGATMAAGALAQAVAYLVTASVMVWLMRRQLGMAIALASLWMIAAFSPLMWGGRVRPEDFGIAFSMLALLGASRDTRCGVVLCGAMTAMAFFTKTSLVLSPLVLGIVGCLVGAGGRERVLRLAVLAGGFMAVTAVVIGWIALMDDPGQWFRQTLQWPAEYKRTVGKAMFSLESVGNLFALLQAGRLQWLFIGSVGGLLCAWRRGGNRLALFVGALLLSECLRVVVEGEPWHYAVAGLVPPMVLGCSLSGCRENHRGAPMGVGVVLILLSPVLAATLPDAVHVAQLRMIEQARTPEEVLVDRMAPHYRPGEQIMVGGQDYQLLLHLNAPRPYPVLPLHMSMVSTEERERAERHFFSQPPEWIIDSRPATSPIPFRCVGGPDDLAYVYASADPSELAEPRSGIPLGARHPVRRPAPNLPSKLLREYPYHLAVDTGLHQAWKLTAKP